MIELLQNYSLSNIFIFIVLLILALKGGISFLDWFTERGNRFFNKTYQKPKELEQTVKELIKDVQNLNQKVDLLIQSDKDSIKSFITKQHHHFCYQVQSIDDQTLDCIQKRYTHYKEEGGNSYIHHLMQELRELPRDISLIKTQ